MLMPQIDLSTVQHALLDTQYTFTNPITNEVETVNGLQAAQAISATQGQNKSCLRAAKPNMRKSIVKRERYGHMGKYRTYPLADCAAAQVWRYVAFEASPLGQHHCMPIMAAFDCPFDMSSDERRRFADWCQSVADIVLTTIKHKPGLDRWGHALGYF